MAAKRKTTAKRATKRRTTATKARRKSITRKPRRRGLSRRAVVAIGGMAARHTAKHTAVRQSRRDAAILRATHAGCTTCSGTGTLYRKKKDGTWAGSKPCPAQPKTMKPSRTRIALESRFGPDKNSGLIGWKCPCGKSEKPRFRDAKTATAALRQHEKKRHGGTTVGGTWYAQLPAGAPTAQTPPVKKGPAMPSKTTKNSGKTDAQWEAQNGALHPDTARKRGLCWHCSGKGALYSAFGGEHITTVCPECKGSGKPAAKAAA